MTGRTWILLGLGLGLVVALALPRALAGQVRPDAAWRSIETEHFVVTFEDGLEELARRAAAQAERAYALLRDTLVAPPRGKIDLVVADNVDFANGFATVVPSNRVTVYVHPPADDINLAYFDDWLELVITHELAHIFHLDETRGLGSVVRRLFGRYPAPWLFFPGLATPSWVQEGLATYYESALTRSGRLRGTYLKMVLRTAILEGRFESVDQASGRSPVWPDGDRAYAYGTLFLDYLLERYGEDRVAAFVHAVAGQLIPYRLNAAAKRAFGVSFSQAWGEWRSALEARTSALADSLARRAPLTAGQPLTHEGRFALYPRFSPDGARIAFARSDGRSDAQVRTMNADGSHASKFARLNGVDVLDWLADGRIIAAQLDYLDPYRLTKDLYLVTGEETRRLTRGARLYHPDVSADGRSAVAVQNGPGASRLVLVDLATGSLRPVGQFRTDEGWAYPRWSPDGRFIAASRWRAGGYFDVIVLDSAGRLLAQVTDDRAVDMAPAWSPDARWLVWSSDRSGIPNLYAVEVGGLDAMRAGAGFAAGHAPRASGPLRQVTNVLGGAFFPDISPDGAWIAYSAYHADGWRIERIPFDPAVWFEPFPVDSALLGADHDAAAEATARAATPADRDAAPARAYRPLRALLPRFWLPLYFGPEPVGAHEVIPGRFGALTAGRDLVGRHAYTLWAVLHPDGPWLEGAFAYDYARLGNPVLGVIVEQEHDALGRTLGRRQNGTVDTLFVTEREQRLTGAATLLRPRVRSNAFLRLSGALVREDRTLFEADGSQSRRYRLQRPASRLGEVAATLGYSNARVYPFSLSAENGIGGFARVRARREFDLADSLRGVPARDRSFQEVTGQLRAYLSFAGPGFANHVLAARLSAGRGYGPGADAGHFKLGGASGVPEALTGLQLFGGTRLLFPVRGYPEAFLTGNNAWSASLEYRFPLLLAHRGFRLWPLYLDRLAATLFLDGGNAWGPTTRAGPELVSAGAELAARILPLWSTTLSLRLGAAAALRRTTGVVTYLRLGPSF